jgi:hypothetical protein
LTSMEAIALEPIPDEMQRIAELQAVGVIEQL